MALLALGFREVEGDRERQGPALRASAPAAKAGHCMLCDALLRRPSTSEEVVLAVEHRIHAELQDISHVLETAPESFGRLYRARA
jgi:hypothetical protein